ncbi:ABC transporter permease [Actinoplanes campanulatus]|nr:ABC transporter permease [Actinoplanes campanulatus]GID37204.1 ABC transporter permease [Actinoplanes campanulatus]
MATMTPTPAGTRAGQAPESAATGTRASRKFAERNWVGGSFAWLWLIVVMVPLYWLVITSFKTQANYFITNPLKPPSEFTFENYQLVIESDFVRYFMNSVIVTVGAVLPATLISFMAAYAVVRGAGNRFLQGVNGIFLMGLAIPLQAVVIPVYLIIIKMELYNTLQAIILPSIAFAIPLSVLVLANFIRDVPKELFESMRMDGATEWGTMWRLAFPLTRPALVTVVIYNAVGIWNGYLLPLILTQSPEKATIPLALASFQTQFGVNVPAVAASVTLTTVPIVLLYAIGRRQLVSGLTAGFNK